jgi:hypothetical protein
MSEVKIPIGILQRISEFLANLPEEHLADLAEGRAQLAFVPVGSTSKIVPGKAGGRRNPTAAPAMSPEDAQKLINHLEALDTRAAAAAEIKSTPKPALQVVAKALNIPSAGGLGVADLRRAIVEATVGRRIDTIARRGFDGLRP